MIIVYNVNSMMRDARYAIAGVIMLSEKWVHEFPNLPCGSEPERTRAPAKGDVIGTKDGELYDHFQCGSRQQKCIIGY